MADRSHEIEGFEVPFHNSLAEPILLGGVPRMFMVINFVFTAELALGMGVPWLGLPAGFIVHTIGYALTKRDPYFFGTLNRHLRQKPYWDA
ncbi:type IV secretion system protein VirB3 [Sphingobium wenxiniae]|uniref:Type IV secretion system protein VirB3 n=1 Tax=Sphingobium wenxiniae (strain DSM 21828 / CGMCC 1.7748 / JZ-1) TaxID=595605 RepID=A0A562K4B4_SPHWJ|nr:MULTISPECIES: VirB3 family type IV secretion system protein [Sphingobium]MBB6193095.1 type IV secretion system protein VirB3 [Sphingobium wenxiniae]TWH90272.1 type IV secretion system protein VirB3 [Sphingobium wenxiniae]